jgi:hypothetical protein
MVKQVQAAVQSAADDKFLYGYKTEPDAGLTTLGVSNLASAQPTKDVAFHPKNVAVWSAYKPGVVARGGLCSFDKLDALETAGYLISRRRLNVPKGGQKSVIVGVRLTPNLVFTWRYRKTLWDALPADVKTAAGVALASTYPANECAFHADGFIFKSAITDLDIPAGVYISKTVLKRTHASAGGKSYTLYTGAQAQTP